MPRKRVLADAAKDPMAAKEAVVRPQKKENPGLGHYVLTIAVGLIAGLIGGLISSRFFKPM